MVARWFHIEDYYERDGDKCVFYPSLYSPGYHFSPDDQAKMDGFLGPFLSGRLRLEFIAILCFVTFSLTIAASGFLVFASNDELDAILAVPPWVWLAVAAGLSGVILLPILIRLRSKIRAQLEAMGAEVSEPPRPDFFVVDGAFSLARLSYAVFTLGTICAIVAVAVPKLGLSLEIPAFAFGVGIALLAAHRICK